MDWCKMMREVMIREALKILEKNYPDGVYISVEVSEETKKNIHGYMDKHLHGFKKHDDIHCTIIYSNKPMDVNIKTEEYTTEATFEKFSLFGEEKNTLVMEINCPKLQERNKELMKEYGFVSDFPEYLTHVTLSYDASNVTVSKLPSFDFPITLLNETVSPLKLDYV